MWHALPITLKNQRFAPSRIHVIFILDDVKESTWAVFRHNFTSFNRFTSLLSIFGERFWNYSCKPLHTGCTCIFYDYMLFDVNRSFLGLVAFRSSRYRNNNSQLYDEKLFEDSTSATFKALTLRIRCRYSNHLTCSWGPLYHFIMKYSCLFHPLYRLKHTHIFINPCNFIVWTSHQQSGKFLSNFLIQFFLFSPVFHF